MSCPILPRFIDKVLVPPIKCQGIKTKLVPFILSSISWQGNGRWIEPFLGSGVVVLNVEPEKALLSDTNPYIISFYKQIQDGKMTPETVTTFLEAEGEQLRRKGEEHYYYVRDRFNDTGESLDFLFLTRSCFNGMMRFNRSGRFNVPFCRKPDRFRQAYVTKIANQIAACARAIHGKAWEFTVADWRDTLSTVREDDFSYLDPPYIGRHTDYFGQWSEQDARDLAHVSQNLPGGLALSMWKKNKYRENVHLAEYWLWAQELTQDHFYYVGARESLRNSMEEALMVTPGYVADDCSHPEQLALFEQQSASR